MWTLHLIEGWEHNYVIVHLCWQNYTSLLNSYLLNNVLAVIWYFYFIFHDNKFDLKTLPAVVEVGNWLEPVCLWKYQVKPSRDKGRLFESIFFYWCIDNFVLKYKAIMLVYHWQIRLEMNWRGFFVVARGVGKIMLLFFPNWK